MPFDRFDKPVWSCYSIWLTRTMVASVSSSKFSLAYGIAWMRGEKSLSRGVLIAVIFSSLMGSSPLG